MYVNSNIIINNRGFLFTAFEGVFLRNAPSNHPLDIHFPLNRSIFDHSSIASAKLNDSGIFQCT